MASYRRCIPCCRRVPWLLLHYHYLVLVFLDTYVALTQWLPVSAFQEGFLVSVFDDFIWIVQVPVQGRLAVLLTKCVVHRLLIYVYYLSESFEVLPIWVGHHTMVLLERQGFWGLRARIALIIVFDRRQAMTSLRIIWAWPGCVYLIDPHIGGIWLRRPHREEPNLQCFFLFLYVMGCVSI